MSKNAVIFHGTGGRPDVIWYSWLADALRQRGYSVEVPHHPELNKEPIEIFLPKVLEAHAFDSNSVIIGHSGGAALILALLEAIDVTVNTAIMVAGYWRKPNTQAEPVLKDHYNWDRIKKHFNQLYIINSVEDPYGCDARQGREIFNQIGGIQIIMSEGHFGDFNQAYPSFPLLEKLIPQV